jgi:hypothetical protein
MKQLRLIYYIYAHNYDVLSLSLEVVEDKLISIA